MKNHEDASLEDLEYAKNYLLNQIKCQDEEMEILQKHISENDLNMQSIKKKRDLHQWKIEKK